MPRRAAGEDHNLLDGAQLVIRDVELPQQDRAVFLGDAPEHRLLDDPGLLEDLLQHEMLVAGFLGHHRIPLDPMRHFRDRLPCEICEVHPCARDHRHLLVAQEDHVACVPEDGLGI